MTEPAERGLERLLLFSDAVVAIAITLIALDLPVPDGASARQLGSSFHQNLSAYVAFVVSFVAIAGAWALHHDVFRFVARFDVRLRTYEFAWLFLIVLNPFVTRLLAEHGHQDHLAQAWRFASYSLLQVLSNATVLAIIRHALNARLLDDVPEAMPVARMAARRCFVPMVAFGLAIPVFFATGYAWVIWVVTPIAVAVAARVRRVRRRPAG